MMQINITKRSTEQMKQKPNDESKIGFGQIMSDHYFNMKYKSELGWYDPKIEPYGDIKLEPASMSLHYGQLLFEGIKAYRGKDGSIYMFRPWDNIHRMNEGAARLCMPSLDESFVLEALKKLIILEKEWIPKGQGTSMYIRPTMIATEPALGIRAANEYLFFIIAGPVGTYYPEGFKPTRIWVEEHYTRSIRGGVGNCKAAGNYAASLLASEKAKTKKCSQVLWLDAIKRKYVEEVGNSNIFFVINDELITPSLSGSILPGITRDSVIQIARHKNIVVNERQISVDEVIDSINRGVLKEIFASGTAAVLSPIGEVYYQDQVYTINDAKTGPLTEELYNQICEIQYGICHDPFGWRIKII